MKVVLITIGIILPLGAVFGVISAGNPGAAGDAVADSANALGITQSRGFAEQVKPFLIDNRVILAIVGALSLLAGLLAKPGKA